MKLLIVSDYYPDHVNGVSGGGIARYNEYLARGLSEIGHEVCVLTYSASSRVEKIHTNFTVYRLNSRFIDFITNRLHRKVPRIRYYASKWRAFKLWKYYKKTLSNLDFDMIEFSDINFPGYFFKVKTPHTIRLHGNYTTNLPAYLDALTPLQMKTWRSFIQNETRWFEESKYFTFMSRYWEQYFQKLWNHTNLKGSVIFNPVDTDEFSPNGNQIDEDECIRVVTSDWLEIRKGMDCVLRLISVLGGDFGNRKIIFNIVGEIRLNPQRYLDLKTLPSGIEVNLFGHCSKAELISHLQNADLFIGPSRFESFSYSLFEAMSCGLPVLVADDHVYPEMVKEGFNGWLYPQNDIEAMKQKFLDVVSNKKRLRSMGRNARNFVLEKASIEKIAKQTETFYKSVLQGEEAV